MYTLTEHVIRNVQGQTLHINLYCTTIEYHTDGTCDKEYTGTDKYKDSLLMNNFNFVQSINDRQSNIMDYRAVYFAAKNMNKEGNSLKHHF